MHLVPDTYSEKVIPAPIRMKVQLESTLPVSTMKRQGKAKMKQVQDTALSTIEYWRITEVRDARILRQTMDTSGWRLVQVQTYINIFFSQGKKTFKKYMPSNPPAKIDVSF